MTNNTIGEVLAILSAFSWASATIFFKLLGNKVKPRTLNLFKSLVGTILFLITIPIFTNFIPENLYWRDIVLLAVSTFIGMVIGDTLFFKSLSKLGGSIIGIVQTLFIPMVIFLAAVFFGEELGIRVYIGATLVVSGILILTINKSFLFEIGKKERKEFLLGLSYGVIAVALWAVSLVIVKKPFWFINYPLIEKFNPIWFAGFRIIFSAIVLLPFSLITKTGASRKDFIKVLKPSNLWKTLMPAAIISAYISIIVWVSAMKFIEKVSVASLLNQLSIIFLIILSWLVLKEKINKRKITASLLALIGAVVILI